MDRRTFLRGVAAAPIAAVPAPRAEAEPAGGVAIPIMGQTADWSREKWLEVIERNGWTLVE